MSEKKNDGGKLYFEVQKLKDGINWIMQTVHRAHHEGSIEDCRKNTCAYARELIFGKESLKK